MLWKLYSKCKCFCFFCRIKDTCSIATLSCFWTPHLATLEEEVVVWEVETLEVWVVVDLGVVLEVVALEVVRKQYLCSVSSFVYCSLRVSCISLFGWRRNDIQKYEGCFFFQPPMGYKKKTNWHNITNTAGSYLFFYIIAKTVEAFVISWHKLLNAFCKEVSRLRGEIRLDGILKFVVGGEALSAQPCLQFSEQLEITWC